MTISAIDVFSERKRRRFDFGVGIVLCALFFSRALRAFELVEKCGYAIITYGTKSLSKITREKGGLLSAPYFHIILRAFALYRADASFLAVPIGDVQHFVVLEFEQNRFLM